MSTHFYDKADTLSTAVADFPHAALIDWSTRPVVAADDGPRRALTMADAERIFRLVALLHAWAPPMVEVAMSGDEICVGTRASTRASTVAVLKADGWSVVDDRVRYPGEDIWVVGPALAEHVRTSTQEGPK